MSGIVNKVNYYLIPPESTAINVFFESISRWKNRLVIRLAGFAGSLCMIVLSALYAVKYTFQCLLDVGRLIMKHDRESLQQVGTDAKNIGLSLLSCITLIFTSLVMLVGGEQALHEYVAEGSQEEKAMRVGMQTEQFLQEHLRTLRELQELEKEKAEARQPPLRPIERPEDWGDKGAWIIPPLLRMKEESSSPLVQFTIQVMPPSPQIQEDVQTRAASSSDQVSSSIDERQQEDERQQQRLLQKQIRQLQKECRGLQEKIQIQREQQEEALEALQEQFAEERQRLIALHQQRILRMEQDMKTVKERSIQCFQEMKTVKEQSLQNFLEYQKLQRTYNELVRQAAPLLEENNMLDHRFLRGNAGGSDSK